MKSQDLKNGIAVNLDGQVWLVVNTDHVKPGKGPAYVQIKIKNLLSGAHQERRLRSGEDIGQAIIDRREIEYLYSDHSGAVFMDIEDFDQFNLSADMLGDGLLYLKPNTTMTGLVHNGSVVSIEMPQVVELQITETSPAIKGATATNQLKEALCETGLKTRVPPFIKTGQTIRINTTSGEYVGRVTSD